MTITTVFWGIGSSIMGDDGAGPAIAKNLARKGLPWLAVFNCETVPENYLAPLKKISPLTLIAADAAEMGLSPGEFRKMELSEFSNISFTTHGFPINLLLEDIEKDIEIITIGIQPLIREPSEDLSKQVHNAVNEIARTVAQRKWKNIPDLYHEKRSPR